MTSRYTVGSPSLWMCLALAILLAACAGTPPRTRTVLTGEKEVPAVNTSASGLTDISAGLFKCPSAASASQCPTIHGTVTTTGVAATAAHVHQAAAGQNGPVIVTLVKTGPDSWAVPQGTTLTDAQYAAYWNGQLYVNVHSAANPGGEIRAQLSPP
jgi:CHRD domain-containing protein